MDTKEGLSVQDVQEEKESIVIKDEVYPIKEVGKSKFAGLRVVYRLLSTIILVAGLSYASWNFLVPGATVWTTTRLGFAVSEGVYTAIYTTIFFCTLPIIGILSWYLGPEIMFMPRDIRLVTQVFGVIPWSRGDWGVFVLLKPIEWPDSIVDVRAFPIDFVGINTQTGDGVPIKVNATALLKIVRPSSVVVRFKDILSGISSVFEPVMETRIGKEKYNELKSNKDTISQDLLEQVRQKLYDLQQSGFDLGIAVATFELKDTPIDDDEVKDYIASKVEIEQRAEGRSALMRADSDYLTGLIDLFMSKDDKLSYQDALDYAIRMAEREAWEKGGALGARGRRHELGRDR